MLSELECGICYRPYNAARRIPRQLKCKHSFCESCLVTLARSAACEETSEEQEPRIICPFCRQATALTEATLRDNFPVDGEALERLLSAGIPEGSEEDDGEESEEPNNNDADRRNKDETVPRTRGGRLWKSMKRFCKKVSGQNRNDRMTDTEMKYLALMSCYMM